MRSSSLRSIGKNVTMRGWLNKSLIIHENASRGEDRLVENPADYEHSSASFYLTGYEGAVKITTWLELQDVDLTQSAVPQSP